MGNAAAPLGAPERRDDEGARRRGKSASAFRTISEVAAELEVPQHVLRFWETKFVQVRPLKRGGGRRYYRPEDVDLLRRIRDLLYRQGYTIKGVQRLMREGGVRALASEAAAPEAAAEEADPLPSPAAAAERPALSPVLRSEFGRLVEELTRLRDLLAEARRH
ncbi:MAG: MerR family transcriptional regulator [Proteobacteria bacterium]|nr:MerR family transcriptional regulator [Pseudomonadota bacterium]